ncbi:MAG: hypothetical protein PHT53_00635 [Candidatus Omnitrophica bacterium]|nr:hypothetical protein [Candidatus Omnitrophota bacterium]
MRNPKTILINAFLILLPFAAFGDTVVLKSGKTIEANLIEQTDEKIKLNINGVPITYYIDEINTINGNKVAVAKTIEGESNIKEFISRVNSAYYNLKKESLKGFKCEVTILSDIMRQTQNTIVSKYGANSKEAKALDSVKYFLIFDENGNHKVEYTPYEKTGNTAFDHDNEKIIQSGQGMIASFCSGWKPFVFNAIFGEASTINKIKETENGFEIAYKNNGLDGTMILNKDFSATQNVLMAGEQTVTSVYKFIQTPKGFLLRDAGMHTAEIKVTFMIEYQIIDGLELLKQVTSRTEDNNHEAAFTYNFSNYELKRR